MSCGKYYILPHVDDSWTVERVTKEAYPPDWKDCFDSASLELSSAAKMVEKKETSGASRKTAPHRKDIFKAFFSVPPDLVRVVIIGQDPYPGVDDASGEFQASGLAFSVKPGMAIPFSLKKIYQEIKRNYPDFTIPTHGDLTKWTEQGILLLNRALTLELGKPNSHEHIWHGFLSRVIDYLLAVNPDCIFCLWGKSREVVDMIHGRGYKLECSHPAASRFGGYSCDHFREVNDILTKLKQPVIDWTL